MNSKLVGNTIEVEGGEVVTVVFVSGSWLVLQADDGQYGISLDVPLAPSLWFEHTSDDVIAVKALALVLESGTIKAEN